jgi:hypothetical protein
MAGGADRGPPGCHARELRVELPTTAGFENALAGDRALGLSLQKDRHGVTTICFGATVGVPAVRVCGITRRSDVGTHTVVAALRVECRNFVRHCGDRVTTA